MPAVTVDDLTTLPRIPAPVGSAQPLSGATGHHCPRAFEGEGFPVRRAFAGVDLARLDPFVHLDHIGEIEYAPGEPKGTPWHPHRGFETVTYMMDGVLRHEDSTGGGGVISNGDTQWMTAGKGILHIETPPDDVVQRRVLPWAAALGEPARPEKWVDPRYQDLKRRRSAGRLRRRRGAGPAHRRRPRWPSGPGRDLHAHDDDPRHGRAGRPPGAPVAGRFNALAYVLAGSALVGPERRPVEMGQLTVFGAGDVLVAEAAPDAERAGGVPRAPRARWTADPRADCLPGTVRHEHPGGDPAGDRRLQRRQAGRIPASHRSPTDDVALRTDSSLD